MSINSLPYDILLKIIRQVGEDKQRQVDTWTNWLKILSVCHKWRLAFQPIAYKEIFIDHGETTRTNLDLLSQQLENYPRTLNLCIMYNEITNLVEHMREGLEKLLLYTNILSQISSLHIWFRHFFTDADNPDNELPIAPEIEEIAFKFASLLPNITSLNCDYRAEEVNAIAFQMALVRHYAPQIKKLEANSLLLDLNVSLTEALNHIHIWNYPGFPLPLTIHTSCLTKLTLIGIDQTFNWRIFSQQSDNKNACVLKFPALVYALISVPSKLISVANANGNSTILAGPSNRFSFRLEMPRLEYLHTYMCPFICSLIAALPKTTVLKTFTLLHFNYSRLVFYDFCISAATQSLFTKYYNSSKDGNTIDNIRMVNDLHQINGAIRNSAYAYINYDLSTTSMQSISWPQVTRLSINTPISLANVLRLIVPKLPRLVWLCTSEVIVLSHYDKTYKLPELDSKTTFNLIDCKLVTFLYGFNIRNSNTRKLYKECNKLMYRIIKSLRCVGFIDDPNNVS